MLEIEDKKSVKVNSVVKNKLKNNKDVKFITFNYTHTLEKNYAIPQTNILHVHGELGKDELVFGNKEENLDSRNPLEFIKDDEEAIEYDVPVTGHDYSSHPAPNLVDFSDYVQKYNESNQEWIKYSNIDEFEYYISNLKVDKIIVIGHSLGIGLYFHFTD